MTRNPHSLGITLTYSTNNKHNAYRASVMSLCNVHLVEKDILRSLTMNFGHVSRLNVIQYKSYCQNTDLYLST